MTNAKGETCAITTDSNHDLDKPFWCKQFVEKNGTYTYYYLCNKHNQLYDLCAESCTFLLKKDMVKNPETGATIGKVDYLGTNVLQGIAKKLSDSSLNSNPMMNKNDIITILQNYAKTTDVNTVYATKNDLNNLITVLKKILPTLSGLLSS